MIAGSVLKLLLLLFTFVVLVSTLVLRVSLAGEHLIALRHLFLVRRVLKALTSVLIETFLAPPATVLLDNVLAARNLVSAAFPLVVLVKILILILWRHMVIILEIVTYAVVVVVLHGGCRHIRAIVAKWSPA